MNTLKTKLAALAALTLSFIPASGLAQEWTYRPMNEAGRLLTPTPSSFPAFAPGTFVNPTQVVCREDGPSGIAFRRAPNADNNRVVVVMMGGGGCVNGELCEANPAQFSYDDYLDLRGNELNSGIFYRFGTENPFRDYHQAFIPYCSGDMHGANLESKVVPGVTKAQKFRGYANTSLYFDEVIKEYAEVLKRPNAEIMLLGQSAGGFGAAFNLPRFRAKVRAVAPNARIIFVSESAPLLDQTVASSCFTTAWRDLFQFQGTFLNDYCPSCIQSNWLAAWHTHLLSSYTDVTEGLITAEKDFVVGGFMRATLPFGTGTCSDNGAFTYDKFKQALIAARDRMVSASLWRGTKTATFFIEQPVYEAFHMFTAYPWYYAIHEDNVWGRDVRLPDWLSGLYGRNPGAGDHVGFY